MFNLFLRRQKPIVRGTCTATLYFNGKVMLIKKYDNLSNAEEFVRGYIKDMHHKGYEYEGTIEEIL